MSGFVQLDLFGDRPDLHRTAGAVSKPLVAPESLSDVDLISAIADASLADASAITAEVGRRRLIDAVSALAALCHRFVGYGSDLVVSEQVAALDALGAIGGREAANAVSRLITRKIVQGPTLTAALAVASQLGVVLTGDVGLRLLRDRTPSVRAAACGCVRTGHDVIATLVSLLSDPDTEVATASACALGRIGHAAARGPLKRYLKEKPSLRIVEALARVADDEALVLLARTGRSRPELTKPVITALEENESPRALNAAGALKRFFGQTE